MTECMYIVIESRGLCPRSLVIPLDIIAKHENLRTSIDTLIKSCQETEPGFFVYTKMPNPNPTEAESIVKCLEYYGDDTPSKWWLFDSCDSDDNTGLPPLYVNGWFKYVDIDIYRVCGMQVTEIGGGKAVKIVKTIIAKDYPVS